MRIREKRYGHNFEVFAIYWAQEQKYYLAFPRRSTGLSAFLDSEVEVTDASLDADFIPCTFANGMRGFAHRHLMQDDLLDNLLEHDPDAYLHFLSLLGREPLEA